MKVVQTQRELDVWRSERSGPVIFVPTMGALHAGHEDLIARAARIARERGLAGGCVVSIFVNPSQFGDPADFARYPKTLDRDLEGCARAGAACVYVPAEADVYPTNLDVAIPPLPSAAEGPGLEDAQRPGHFAGVCRVVKRLFEIVRPLAAVFGEKDWQQLVVVRSMTEEQRLGVEIVGAPTVREADGLAMSSRNRFLTEEDRRRAVAISRALHMALEARTAEQAEVLMISCLGREGIAPDYAVVRDERTLREPGEKGPWRALIAARVGTVRLIDNAAWVPRR